MNPSLRLPKFRLPAIVARIGQHLPQWPHALVLVAGLNGALKMQLLPADSLALLEGKSFRIHVRDTAGIANFTYRGQRFRPLLNPPDEADLAFSANLSAYLQLLARQEDPDTLFFSRELEISGDTELGLVVKNMLDAVDWPSASRFLPFLRSA